MQPTFLPWAGYFNLISQANFFVFLDDVQYEKNSWQNRNRILLNENPHWVTVPIKYEQLDKKILETKMIEHARWKRKLVSALRQNYSRSPYFNHADEIIQHLESTETTMLAELNISLIQFISEKMDLKPRFMRASAIEVLGARTERLVKICKLLGCNEYLSPVGAAAYLSEDGDFVDSGVSIRLQDFIPQPYKQLKSKTFVSHLSIVDVIANLGWMAGSAYCTTKPLNEEP